MTPRGAVAALAAAGMLAGCAAGRPVEGPVRLGRIAAAGGPRVRPDRVLEDSRCPAGVACVAAGRLVLRTTVFGGGWNRTVDLTLSVPSAVADGMLTLTAADPAPRAGRRTRPSAYRFAFLFQGGL